jgi:hypothetical protein
MNTRIYHGEVKAKELAKALASRFTYGNLLAQYSQSGKQYSVIISSRRDARSGGKTAVGITIQQNKDGVTVKIGEQEWLGIAASLGTTLLSMGRNPLNLLGRLDDIAQDIENLNLDEKIWDVIEEVAFTMGASHQLSEKLRRTGCEYCNTANPVGEPRCIACGAPLGGSQPRLCHHCGFVASPTDVTCSNCGSKVK